MRHRILGSGVCYYHVLSRVIERRYIFDDRGRRLFRKMMRQQEAFSGVRVLTWTCLSNHFHMLVAVEDRNADAQRRLFEQLMADDEAFFARLRHIYLPKALKPFRKRLELIRESRLSEEAKTRQVAKFKQPFLDRMFNLSSFVGEVKQRLSQWYNREHERIGPLWEDRFKSVLVQGEPGVLATVAAYIDLNSVRAGLVKDPRDWKWCGYAEAVAAQGVSRNGVYEVFGLGDQRGDGRAWKKIHRRYREILMTDGIQGRDEEGRVVRKGITPEKFAAEEARDFELPVSACLRHRIRYLSDGLALGCADFVESIFLANRDRFGVKRTKGAREPKNTGLRDLCSLVDLRIESRRKGGTQVPAPEFP